jgi:type II secretory pathway pseudopilin PulG
MRARTCGAGNPEGAAGFTYIGLLIAVVVLGIALSAVGMVWRTHAQREREQELLFIGRQFESAIASYYRSSAGGIRQYPQDINDLLEDKRFPEPKHHLRRLYVDPMTGDQDWTILRIEGLGITGIASSSQSVPLKKAGFPADEEAFKDAKCYCDWKFEYLPRNVRRRINSVPAAAD